METHHKKISALIETIYYDPEFSRVATYLEARGFSYEGAFFKKRIGDDTFTTYVALLPSGTYVSFIPTAKEKDAESIIRRNYLREHNNAGVKNDKEIGIGVLAGMIYSVATRPIDDIDQASYMAISMLAGGAIGLGVKWVKQRFFREKKLEQMLENLDNNYVTISSPVENDIGFLVDV